MRPRHLAPLVALALQTCGTLMPVAAYPAPDMRLQLWIQRCGGDPHPGERSSDAAVVPQALRPR
jgi:hypothetical protein